ncbi:MAG: hypothetical protein IKA05_02440 [Clostridia bacterium]|nr:hypothetical protein [Clostridia bacterium]
MKQILRICALFLALCLLTGAMTSCFTLARLTDLLPRETQTETRGEGETEEDGKGSVSAAPNRLRYTLNEAYVESFYALLEDCETLTLAGTDVLAIEAAWEELEASYYHISSQAQVAYIWYCIDSENETYEEQYLTSSEVSGETYDAYMAVCRRIDESSSPYREEFFSDWTADEIEQMRSYSSEVTELEQINDRFLVDYRDLDLERQEAEMIALYRAFVENQNAIAALEGYESYYEYASAEVFSRDYGKAERERFRGYVKEYLVPLSKVLYESLMEKLDALNMLQYGVVSDFMSESYDSLSKDYLDLYLSSFDADTQSVMRQMLDEEHSLFVNSYRAYDGAFTTYLQEDEAAFCYFGPSYQDIMTVAHEMGHFYAFQTHVDSTDLLDLAETHSQGNEWLMMAFLEDEISSALYEAILCYQLYDALATVIVSTIVDEFEEAVYTGNVDMSRPDDAMDRIAEGYGGKVFLREYLLDDINLYWKYVVVESPVYYLSYAISGMASLSLYTVAAQDYARGQSVYCSLVEEADLSGSFEEILADAGLASPFDAELYQALQSLMIK